MKRGPLVSVFIVAAAAATESAIQEPPRLRNETVREREKGFDRVPENIVATALCRRGRKRLDTARSCGKDRRMKKLGMILLGLFLIIDALLGFGVNIGPLVFLLYLIGFAAGVLILIGA